jgi:hypothetical protein
VAADATDARAAKAVKQALSLNGLFLTPARVRWRALHELWLYRHYWRLPHARQAMRAERDNEIAEMVPIVLLTAVLAAALLFLVLPSNVGEQATEVLSRVWPWCVVHVAPLFSALTLAMLNAPSIALQLTEREAAGEFEGQQPGDVRTRSALAAHLCVPLTMAHATVCLVCTVLLTVFTMGLGLLADLVWAVGDVRALAEVVFTQVSPLAWLQAMLSAWVLGLVCTLAAVVYAWPGTQITQRGLDSHRLGLRAMMVSAVACVLATVAFNWTATVLGWHALS